MKRFSVLTVAAVTIALLSAMGGASVANASTPLSLWAISTAGTGVLYSVDPVSGATTAVGAGTGIAGAQAAALDPITGAIVAIDFACNLYTVDVVTGSGTPVGVALSGTIAGNPINACDTMTIGADGRGYSSVQTAVNNNAYFVSFDWQTGVTTPVGPQMNDYYNWMAFDPTSGILYGQNNTSGDVYSMDPASGVEQHVSAFSPYSYNVVIAPDGSFYANDYFDLVSGLVSTWTGTVVGPFSAPLDVEGSNVFFTTTNVFPAAAAPAAPPPAGLAATGIDADAVISLAAGGLFSVLLGVSMVLPGRMRRSSGRL